MPLVTGPERTRRFFDWLAPRYNAVNSRLFRPEWRALVRAAIEPGRVLDVGVGTGYTSGDLDDAVGLDVSREMLARAVDFRGHLVHGDATAAPFRAHSFGTIVCAGSFYYLPDPVSALRIFYELLSENGCVVMISPEAWFLRPLVRIYTRDDYAAMAASAGFSLERHKSLLGLACLVKMRKRPARDDCYAFGA